MPSRTGGVIYAGGKGEFSRLPLDYLLARGVEVAAVLTARRRGELPLTVRGESGVENLALAHGIPLLGADRRPSAAQLADLRALQARVMLVACYPWRMTSELYELCPLGAVNLHPSLLPAYRGPDPIYWQLHDAVTRSGASLHRVTARLDAGAIVAQSAYALTGGEEPADLTRALARLGAELFAGFLENPHAALRDARPQDERRASWYGFAGG